jgi:uracil-DNA glycosylase
MNKLINIPDDWYRVLQPIIESDYFKKLATFLQDRRTKTSVFPESKNVFRAFQVTPLSNVRVVIIGMD